MWRDVGHTYVQYYFYVQITFVGKNIKFVATKNTLTYSNIIMSCNLKNDATYIFDDTKKFRLIFRINLYSTYFKYVFYFKNCA